MARCRVDGARPGACVRHDAELVAAVGAVLAVATADAWEAVLGDVDVAAVRASDVPLETWFEQEGRLLPEDHPVFGPFWRAPVKVELSGYPPRVDRVCGLGEHTRPILAELGYGDADVDRLVAAGVVLDGAALATGAR